MTAARRATVLWLLALAACGAVVAQARFTADMSAFLPELATPLQRLLADQLREGVASRLVLVGIEGAAPERLAAASRALAARLRERAEFAYVANGEARLAQADRDFLFAHRYVLVPDAAAGRFDADALERALARAYDLLASPAGVLVRPHLPADPTGEFLRLAAALEGAGRPPMRDGVWMSRDGRYALLLVQTAARGLDLDEQSRTLALVRSAFDTVRAAAGAHEATLVLSGPPVFAVGSRAAIRGDAERLAAIATVLVVAILLAAFRSPRLVLLAFVPVASGALAGVAAVAVGFDTVHAITLGFGVTLVGEAVDYAVYLFAQRRAGEAPDASFARIAPTLRLGLVVSGASFCAMLFSGFPGLAQLGLFSVVGLAAALATAAYVLPALVPAGGAAAGARPVGRVAAALRLSPAVRFGLLAAALAVSALVIARHQPVWDDDLGRLNPASAADQALDQRLRDELGAPDVRWLLVASAADAEGALVAAEDLAASLAAFVRDGVIAGYESPAAWLPSRRAQTARRAALPDEPTLRANLDAAVAASAFKPGQFEPFIRDVAAARTAPALERASLRGTGLGLKVDALLVEREGAWHALLPLRGVADGERLARRVAGLGMLGVHALDIKGEATALVRSYREHATALWGGGLVVIVAALLVQLRSPVRTARVLLPVAAAVATTAACLLVDGERLTLFHLVALLLVVGVGSNYALFFDRVPSDRADRDASLFALALCALTTALAFGLLAASHTPVLRMIGATVAIGAVLSLVFSLLVARPAERE